MIQLQASHLVQQAVIEPSCRYWPVLSCQLNYPTRQAPHLRRLGRGPVITPTCRVPPPLLESVGFDVHFGFDLRCSDGSAENGYLRIELELGLASSAYLHFPLCFEAQCRTRLCRPMF